MPRLLALDIGSSSTKAALIVDGRIHGDIARVGFATHFAGERVEVPADRVFDSIGRAIGQLKPRPIDCVAISAMGPSWVAMDARGRAITPIITHQDRRSVTQAHAIERAIGKTAHLRTVGARPIPGGISSTTWRWFAQHAPSVMRRADLVGHLPTLLLRRWCGVRAIDPSHASFTGLFRTRSQSGWDDALIAAARARRALLPEIVPANQIAGKLNRTGAQELGLAIGTPVLPGIMDGSVPILFAGAQPGRIVNICGSTDVLAVCVDRFCPHEQLLVRALGVGKLWLAVSTISASGSSLDWAHRTLFADLSPAAFAKMIARLAAAPAGESSVSFAAALGGDRTEIEQRASAFEGLQLSTGREEMLRAMLVALRKQSAQRIGLFTKLRIPMKKDVLLSGGSNSEFGRMMTSAWPGRWRFGHLPEATLAGLARLLES